MICLIAILLFGPHVGVRAFDLSWATFDNLASWWCETEEVPTKTLPDGTVLYWEGIIGGWTTFSGEIDDDIERID